MMTRGPVSTVIVDPQAIFRRGLRCVLEETGRFDVVAEGATVADARELLALNPDVATIEMQLPDGDGMQVVREAQARGGRTACVLVTESPCERAVLSAVMAGAAGVLDKESVVEDLVASLDRVADLGTLFADDCVQELLEDLQDTTCHEDETLAHLTPQERRVFELVGQGLTNREVGDQLRLTEKTVKNYVSRILAKLGMGHRAEIAMLAGRLTARDELAAVAN